MIVTKEISGIVLAGGKSSRMGTDKGLLELNHKPFISYILEAMIPLVSEILIVSNQSEYDAFGYDRVPDIIADSGPLAGIYSGLMNSKTEYNLILSCDIPLIRTEVLQQLLHHADEDHDIIQIESRGKTMPLIALYKSSCIQTFRDLLDRNEYRLGYALEQCKVKNVKIKGKDDFTTTNINTDQEFKKLMHDYKG